MASALSAENTDVKFGSEACVNISHVMYRHRCSVTSGSQARTQHALGLTLRNMTSVSERLDLNEARWSYRLARLVVIEPLSSAEQSDEGAACHAQRALQPQYTLPAKRSKVLKPALELYLHFETYKLDAEAICTLRNGEVQMLCFKKSASLSLASG